MTRRRLSSLTRNAEGPILLERFLITAVASLLAIRWFLSATGYPQLGSNGLHIAHMLWGGLLMLLALLLLLAFLDRWVEHVAAVIAGVGFGTFIDEIGKFVTSDNNYFFQPAIALIYVVFVAAFMVGRTFLGTDRRLSSGEAIANALDLLVRRDSGPLAPDDRAEIERLLTLADPDQELTRLTASYLAELPLSTGREGRLESIQQRVAVAYDRLAAHRWADRFLVAFGIVYAVSALVGVTSIALATPAAAAGGAAGVAALGQIISTVVGAVLTGIGVLRLHVSRIEAYRWFVRGLLVWILVTQVFVFYSSQLAGLGGLAIDLLAYGALQFALRQEKAGQPSSPAAAAARS